MMTVMDPTYDDNMSLRLNPDHLTNHPVSGHGSQPNALPSSSPYYANQSVSPSSPHYSCSSSLSPVLASVSSDYHHHLGSSVSYSSPDSKLSAKSPSFPKGSPGTAPVAVRRNERERNRVKLVNLGFNTLRHHVPNGAKNKKMSKVETLRSAVDYIRELQALLGELDHSEAAHSSGMSTSSPTSSEVNSSYCRQLSSVAAHHSPGSVDSPQSDHSDTNSYEQHRQQQQQQQHHQDGHSGRTLSQSEQAKSYVATDEDLLSFSKWFS